MSSIKVQRESKYCEFIELCQIFNKRSVEYAVTGDAALKIHSKNSNRIRSNIYSINVSREFVDELIYLDGKSIDFHNTARYVGLRHGSFSYLTEIRVVNQIYYDMVVKTNHICYYTPAGVALEACRRLCVSTSEIEYQALCRLIYKTRMLIGKNKDRFEQCLNEHAFDKSGFPFLHTLSISCWDNIKARSVAEWLLQYSTPLIRVIKNSLEG